MFALAQVAPAHLGAQSHWDARQDQLLEILHVCGPWILLGIAVLLAMRALSRHKRHRVDAVLGPAAQAVVHAAIAGAERRTVGEILPVVLERSDRHPGAEWLSGLCALLAGTALLEGVLPWDAPGLLLLSQLGLGLAGFLLARALPAWKRMFVSEARATEMAEEQALQEFHRHELHRTERRTGVLILVSLLERRVVVLGDAGIDERVGAQHWERTRDAILAGVARSDLAAGLVEGIRACGDVLAQHFPPTTGDRNEVPDRLIVRRE